MLVYISLLYIHVQLKMNQIYTEKMKNENKRDERNTTHIKIIQYK